MRKPTNVVLAGLLVAVFAAVAGVGSARAEEAKPSAEAMKEAKAHYLQGKAFQDAGAYDQAIAEYQTAYKLAPLSDLLFNLAQCARLKGDKRTALAEYKRYLAAAPDGRGAPDARKFVALLTKELSDDDAKAAAQADAERKRAAEAEAAAKAERERGATAPPPVASAEPKPEALAGAPGAGAGAAATATTTAPPPASPTAGRTLRLAGLATAGVGVALIGVGVAFGLKAKSASNDLAGLGDSGGTWDQGLYDSGKSAQRNMLIFVGVGGAAVVGGGVMYLLGHRAAAAETAVAAAPLPGGAALAFSGRF